MRYIDANIIPRALVQPTTPVGQSRHRACAALFQRVAAGAEQVTTAEVIIAEVLYVLTSPRQYGLTHREASARLRPILTLRGLRLPHQRAYLRALDFFADSTRLDFEDALLVAHLERTGEQELYSYNTDFDRLPTVARREP